MQKIIAENLDWNLLWQNAAERMTRKRKGPDSWDKRAESFARRTANSIFGKLFIEFLQPEQDWSILDIGCGPGTLSIPLSQRVKHVSALDFSPRMLQIVRNRAQEKKITNISLHNLSWEDDWQARGLKMHDVTIASRSLGVRDLRTALEKLNQFARKAVVVADKVGPGPFDPAAFAAVGREFYFGPDYIYTVNLLYQMGIHTTVNFIRLENSHVYASPAEAFDNYSWMFKDLTAGEKKRLREYIDSITEETEDNTIILKPAHVTTWAFLRWSP